MSEELAIPATGLLEMGGQRQRMSTSLDMSKQADRRKFLSCMNDCDFKLTEEVNKAIVVTDYFAHDVTVTNKDTGEVSDCVRMVLIDKEGKTHECVSATLLRSIQNIAFACGSPPWPKGLELTVRTKKRGAFSIYWFDVK